MMFIRDGNKPRTRDEIKSWMNRQKLPGKFAVSPSSLPLKLVQKGSN